MKNRTTCSEFEIVLFCTKKYVHHLNSPVLTCLEQNKRRKIFHVEKEAWYS